MGLDVALGVVILIAAIRGWLQGFVYQTVRLAGLVACIYLAAPFATRRSRTSSAICRRFNPIWWTASCGGFRPSSPTWLSSA